MLQAWRTHATEQLTRRLESARDDPRDQVRDLISLPFRGRSAVRAARIELAIRAWARRDAWRAPSSTRPTRHAWATSRRCSPSLGFAIAEARARAFLLYSYELAESLLSTQGSAAQRQERAVLVERLVQLKLPK